MLLEKVSFTTHHNLHGKARFSVEVVVVVEGQERLTDEFLSWRIYMRNF